MSNRSSNFQWQEVRYNVRESLLSAERKEILKGISSGEMRKGLHAIMGPSGSGKTTLLNLLSLNPHNRGQSTGQVLLNGDQVNDFVFRRSMYLMTQEDHLSPFLTPFETLQFAAQYANKDKEAVTRVIKDLGLEECQHLKCGNAFFHGLSGGQKRKLSVAIALMNDPVVIFLDEPTSGLDSASADAVMTMIHRVANDRGIIAVCNIHQPSTMVFNCFDSIMLLSNGSVVYSGPAGEAATQYLSNLTQTPMPEHTNPAEFMLSLVNEVGDAGVSREEAERLVTAWTRDGARAVLRTAVGGAQTTTTQLSSRARGGEGPHAHHFIVQSLEPRGPATGYPLVEEGEMLSTPSGTQYPPRTTGMQGPWNRAGILKQTWTHLQRQCLIARRDPTLYGGRVVMNLFSGIFFALVFIKSRERVQDQVAPRMFLSLWLIGVPAIFGVVSVYAYNFEFREVHLDIRNGSYHPCTYLAANTLIQLPCMIVLALASIGIGGYGMADFEVSGFGDMLVIFSVAFWAFENMAQVLALVPHPLVGSLCYVFLWFTSFLFGGTFTNEEDLWWGIRWLCFVLPFRWAIPAIVGTELKDSVFEGAYVANNEDGFECTGTPRICYGPTGQDALRTLSRNYPLIEAKTSYTDELGYLTAVGLGFKLIFFVVFVLKTRAAKAVELGQHGRELQAASTRHETASNVSTAFETDRRIEVGVPLTATTSRTMQSETDNNTQRDVELAMPAAASTSIAGGTNRITTGSRTTNGPVALV